MNPQQMALSVLIIAIAGCASSHAPPAGFTGKGGAVMEIGEPEARDPLVNECKVKCSVSPGPGCC
jgi:hypothetical protein